MNDKRKAEKGGWNVAVIKNTSVTQSGSGEKDEPKKNGYFLLVSDRYIRTKYICIILLAFFLGTMMIAFGDEITYSGLMYLIRDLNTGGASYSAGFGTAEYSEQDNMSYALYRGELAVIGNRTLKMYNGKGEENRSYELGYAEPALAASDKYLLAYNIGATDYSVYTSIARVHNGNASGKIECADVNDKGDQLLVCRSDQTKYVVSTYDSSFRSIANYYKNRYVTSAAIGNDGRVVIVSFGAESGGFDCEVELYYDGADKPESIYTADGVFPVRCGIWKNGGYFVICTDRVLFFGNKGTLIKSEETAVGYETFSVSDSALAVSSADSALGGGSDVFVFDMNGDLLYNSNVSGSASSLALSENAVYVLAGDTAYMLPTDGENVISTDVRDGGGVLLSSGDSAVLCRNDGAEGLVFNSADESDTDAVP